MPKQTMPCVWIIWQLTMNKKVQVLEYFNLHVDSHISKNKWIMDIWLKPYYFRYLKVEQN